MCADQVARDRRVSTHNPKVAGSNPAPATNEIPGQRPFRRLRRGGPLAVFGPLYNSSCCTAQSHDLLDGRTPSADVVWPSRSTWGFASVLPDPPDVSGSQIEVTFGPSARSCSEDRHRSIVVGMSVPGRDYRATPIGITRAIRAELRYRRGRRCYGDMRAHNRQVGTAGRLSRSSMIRVDSARGPPGRSNGRRGCGCSRVEGSCRLTNYSAIPAACVDVDVITQIVGFLVGREQRPRGQRSRCGWLRLPVARQTSSVSESGRDRGSGAGGVSG